MLNIDSIEERFSEFSGLTLDEAARYTSLISSAKALFEKLLKRPPAEGEEKDLCEYACACRAFFDYTLLLAATENTYSTKTGSVYAKNPSGTVVNAERLMKSASAALPRDLFEAGDFIFESVEG